ncbi:ATP-binding cassette sub-family b member 1 [Plakobranchus ocellatus]|uniref:ATP-binding cassette sub-family b member 1 n=1 Tax=Plakobranchus ocellatus TaxID=259542 RepID=A0AAV4DQ01_9GAST|nr:ATP-binding cassette sub-family b member 1 [Plakobranchus ocellatus]
MVNADNPTHINGVNENGSVINNNPAKKIPDKRQLVDNLELPPKYSATNGADWSTAEDGDGEDENGNAPEPKAPKVGTLELFRFANKDDKLLIYVAVFCSIVHGVSYPAMVVLFAKAIEQFVNHGKFDRLLDRVPDFLHANNMSWSETRKHLEDFEPHCQQLHDFYNGTERLSCEVLDDDFDDVFEEIDKIALQFISIKRLYFVGGFIVICAAFGQIFIFILTSEKQIVRMRLAFYKNIMRQEMGWFDSNSCGEMTVKLTE